MKRKLICVTMVLVLASAYAVAGGNNENAAAPAATASTRTATTTAAATGNFRPYPTSTGPYTNATQKYVTFGTQDISYEGPYCLTAIGQSADVAMMDALFKMVGVKDYSFDTLATPNDIAKAKTVIICSGMSSKGLGAAGISLEDEKIRADQVLAICKSRGINVVFAHLGGSARRGPTSDEFSDQVMGLASYMLVVEGGGGNDDGKFTTFATRNNVPITLTYNIVDCLDTLRQLFVSN